MPETDDRFDSSWAPRAWGCCGGPVAVALSLWSSARLLSGTEGPTVAAEFALWIGVVVAESAFLGLYDPCVS
jgi:hypothetical protein